MNKASICLVTAAAACLAVVLPGCETDSASQEVRISPDSVTVKKGQTVEFTATGGYEYEWSLEHPEWGALSTRRGDRTSYTSMYSPETNGAVQVLTATSHIPGSPEASSNVPRYQVSGEAHIFHE